VRGLVVDIHQMTLDKLPKFETFDHLETLHETGSLADKELFESLHSRLDTR
jgi:hypothetical protein